MHKDLSFVQYRPQLVESTTYFLVVDFLISGKVVAPVEGISSWVQYRPQLEPLYGIGRILASLRFEQRGKLDQLGIETGSFDWKSADFGSSPIYDLFDHISILDPIIRIGVYNPEIVSSNPAFVGFLARRSNAVIMSWLIFGSMLNDYNVEKNLP